MNNNNKNKITIGDRVRVDNGEGLNGGRTGIVINPVSYERVWGAYKQPKQDDVWFVLFDTKKPSEIAENKEPIDYFYKNRCGLIKLAEI